MICEKYLEKFSSVNVPAHSADVYKTNGSNAKLIKIMKFKKIEVEIKNTINN